MFLSNWSSVKRDHLLVPFDTGGIASAVGFFLLLWFYRIVWSYEFTEAWRGFFYPWQCKERPEWKKVSSWAAGTAFLEHVCWCGPRILLQECRISTCNARTCVVCICYAWVWLHVFVIHLFKKLVFTMMR